MRSEAEKKQKPKRYKLDVSSQFYPIISTPRAQSLFRVTAVMKDKVDGDLLQRVAESVLNRFPTFKVRLRKGYSWYYFEENTNPFRVGEADDKLLTPINPKETAGYLFRITHRDCNIIFEVFHAVCDGLAALEFLKAVIYRYAVLKGDAAEGAADIIDINALPDDEELEDSFYRYYRPIKFGDVNLKGLMGEMPLLLDGTPTDDGYKSDYESLSTSQLLSFAKKMGTTVTAFLCGAMAFAVEKATCGKKPIVMMVPVNLRKMFPSRTLRNFVNFVRIVFEPKKCTTLGDYVAEAAAQLKEKATKEEMEKFFATTVRTEKSLVLNAAPLWFKIFMARIFRFFLKSRQTMIFSNMGKVNIPEECGLKRMVFNVNVSKRAKVNVGAVTVGDETTITFTRSIKERTIEKEFFAILAAAGLVPTAKSGC